jgi:hypothetical protein
MVNANYGLSLGAYFGAALNTSVSSTTDLVPSIFPVAINGAPYQLDFSNPMGGNLYRRDSVALLRTQADSARTAGESSVSPEIFWRRSFDSWHAGCGQTHADRETSNPYRFRSSKGMDVWSKGQLKALNDVTAQNPATANENIGLVVAGTRLYAYNGTSTYYTTSTSGTWSWSSAVSGTPANAPQGIASDGKNVWLAHTTAIYKTDTSSSSATAWPSAPASNTWTGIWFNKGKLFASASNSSIYEIVNSSTATQIINRSTLGFTWTSATGVGGYHYFGGYNGDKSQILKMTLGADGAALTANTAVVAGELPDGELVYNLDSYLGYLIIGTSKGVRFANTDSNGYITIGGLIETGQPVYCSEGQDRFVWFGWGRYDSVSSGLGRMDLAEFTATLTPAYASDLMAGKPALNTSTSSPTAVAPILGDVKSVVTWNNTRVFAVAAQGIFAENTSKVPLATLDTGLISHGIIDNKYAAFLDARMEPLAPNTVVKLSHSVDSGSFITSGSQFDDGAVYTGEFFVGDQGRNFELKITFGDVGPATLVTSNVTCTGFMLRSYPAPKRISKFSVPVMLFDSINVGDRDWAGNPGTDFSFLTDLHKKQLPFTYQEGEVSYTVVMDDYQWLPEKRSNVSGFQGTFVAVLREIL